MSVLYALIFTLPLMCLYYPYYKSYQLGGYIIDSFLRDFFVQRYTFVGKNRLMFTKRIFRFLIAFFILIFSLSHLTFLYVSDWRIALILFIIFVISPVIFILAHLIMYPVEILIKKSYISKTRKKLKKFKGIKIAITGSYGKTSVKNILKHLLEDKFKVIASPKNYNTPMGVCKTVASELKEDTQIAIFEMGARREGDIRELMEIIRPDIGILTAIGEQHLDTFGNLKTIIRTKNEIVKFMQGQGKIFFDGENENTLNLYKKCSKNKELTCSDKGISSYSNIEYSPSGMSFDIKIRDQQTRVRTKLLGNFNCKNIVIAASVASYLGVSFDDIVKQIETLDPVKNRLELINMKDFSIIDDSYNANEVGVRESLNVLKKFMGRKIVITSGLVEMGDLQYEKNFKIGKQIAKSANMVVIMNETNKKAIYKGLKEEGFEEENIFYAQSREEQMEIIKKLTCKGCVFLFQNDLPDNYR